MTAWTNRYVDGLDYTFDFYRELTPSILNFAALCHAHKFDFSNADLAYCELGCGQGFSTNLLAAANPDITFHANDFSPSHIAGARSLARLSQLDNIHFYEDSFAEFADQPKLPESFDVIALHGVFSWISPENRREIINFISRKLRPGGLVYVSYNTLPGWASVMPLRRILRETFSLTSGPIVPRIEHAMQTAQTLVDSDAAFFKQSPFLKTHLAHMRTMSRNYLAHEYMNEDWHPMYFRDVVDELAGGKLSYLGSLDLSDRLEEQGLTNEQRDVLASEVDPLRREEMRAFMTNEQFRRDLFSKGKVPHSVRSNAGGWIGARFVLTRDAEIVSAAVRRRFKHAESVEKSLQRLIVGFRNGPISVRELLGDPIIGASSTWGQVTEGLTMLVGGGYLHPCLAPDGQERRQLSCQAFNTAVCGLAKDSETLQFLASPITGGGLRVDRFEQLFLLAIKDGLSRPDEWAGFAWSILAPQGQKLLKDGVTIEQPEENLRELCRRADKFQSDLLPTCTELGVNL